MDPRDGLTSLDWLSLTGQAVLGVVAGPVFVDTSGELTAIRDVRIAKPRCDLRGADGAIDSKTDM